MAVPVIGYVRVSRVGARGGDSFLSPELQREEIDRECQRSNLGLLEVYEELDKSGGDNTRPLWNKALERVEQGQAKGIVVWNLSRFSRSLVDAVAAIERIEKAGGSIYSASGEAGDNTPTGKLTRNIFLALAQMERERARDGFRAAQGNAIERGLFTASRIPVGYLRTEQRKLEPDPVMAPKVKELFERRKARHSWTDLAKWFIENGGSLKTDRTAIKWIISNPTYLGWSRSGDIVNKKAHLAIVSQKLYDEANAVVGKRPKHTGRLAAQTLLRGLIKCGACGHTLALTNIRGTAGYACINVSCTERAGARAPETDSEIVWRVMAYINMWGRATYLEEHDTARDKQEARTALEEARYDRKLFIDNRELRRLLSVDEYNAQLESLNELVSEAQLAYEMIQEDTKPTIQDFGAVWDSWSSEDKRQWLSTFLDTIILKSAHKRRVPVADRLAIMIKKGNQERWLLYDGTYTDEPWPDPSEVARTRTATRMRILAAREGAIFRVMDTGRA
jgi:DNA invertase Pin-like site-specific DNA recombinase